MATFYETKQLICRLLCGRNIEDSDDDITIDLRSFRTSYGEQQESGQFVVSNTELHELYDKVCTFNHHGLEMYNGFEYEIAMDLDYPIMRRQEFPIISEDIANGVKYELGYPTIEYSLYLLMLIKDEMNKQQGRNNKIPPARLRRPNDRHLSSDNDISLSVLLPRIIGELSLKIRNTNATPQSLNNFSDLKTSFVFEFMYKTGNSLVEFLDIIDMFPLNNTMRGRLDITQIDTPPLRKYTEDVVDYYKQALASNDPYIKFISFYHVMEYFFDEVFKRKMVTDLKNKITHPDFSYKDEDKVYEIALFVKNRLRMNDETGQGNELESLKYVLSEFVSIDDLKLRIDAIDSNAVQYYQSSKVLFCNAPTIGWSDMQGVFTQIARRIYFTRNSLVHSKSGKNKERYRPYQDEKQLQLEIPLVKAVAEAIIINSSEII
ncbi:hypothetical protein MUJ63_03375 [Lachnospiraceae bacterium NSJ-143]|nr:hypothetical protein [Lachnospiraceae bacterium NSJ-143]